METHRKPWALSMGFNWKTIGKHCFFNETSMMSNYREPISFQQYLLGKLWVLMGRFGFYRSLIGFYKFH